MKVKIFDTLHTELKIGDFVKIQERRNNGLTFYTKVEVYKGHLFPLQFFTYDKIIKIEEIPEGCNPVSDSPVPCWMGFEPLTEIDEDTVDIWKIKAFSFNSNKFIEVIG